MVAAARVASEPPRARPPSLFRRASQLVEVPDALPIPPVSTEWTRRSRFTLIAKSRWQWEGEHINIKAARIALMQLHRLCRRTDGLGCRKLDLEDSLVTAGAFGKGRSASRPLLALSRRAATYQLAARI